MPHVRDRLERLARQGIALGHTDADVVQRLRGAVTVAQVAGWRDSDSDSGSVTAIGGAS
jgi:hypothetical protein